MRKKVLFLAVAFLAAGLLLLGSSQRVVKADNNHVVVGQCQGPSTYHTIQQGVNAVNDGGEVDVCPGTYPEQVEIFKHIKLLGITSGNNNQVLIQPSPMHANVASPDTGNPIAAVILVADDDVQITNVTVDGRNNGDTACSNAGGFDPIGIIGLGTNNLQIEGVAVRNMAPGYGMPSGSPLRGCQDGFGVVALAGARLQIRDSSIHENQKGDIVANDNGTQLQAQNNSVAGFSFTPDLAQNGIQIGFGATGEIQRNSVRGHAYMGCTSAGCTAVATNILIFNPGQQGAHVHENVTNGANVNIFVQGDNSEVQNNIVSVSNPFDGVDVVGNKNHVGGNNIYQSGASGVFIQGNNNDIGNNLVNESPVGYLVGSPSSNNNLHFDNHDFFNTTQNIIDPVRKSGIQVARP